MAEWLVANGFKEIDKGVRSRLLECLRHRDEVERWRQGLTDGERFRFNHPNTVLRRWKKTITATAPNPEPKPSPVAKLKETIVALEEANHRMRCEIERGGGDLWSLDDFEPRHRAGDAGETWPHTVEGCRARRLQADEGGQGRRWTGSRRMTALTTIAPRLRKLLLMLSSSADGEVVGAARAIGRALQSVGADWHALAGLLTEPPQPRKAPRPDDDAFADDWRDMRQFCLDHDWLLRDREREFLTSIGDWRGTLTDKQFAWLASIHARVSRHSA